MDSRQQPDLRCHSTNRQTAVVLVRGARDTLGALCARGVHENREPRGTGGDLICAGESDDETVPRLDKLDERLYVLQMVGVL